MNSESKNELNILSPTPVRREMEESSSSLPLQAIDSTSINRSLEHSQHPDITNNTQKIDIGIITADSKPTGKSTLDIQQQQQQQQNSKLKQIQSKYSTTSPIIILFIELALALATIFPLVVGIIYDNIAYLLYGVYGILTIPFTLGGLYAIGILAKFDKIPLVKNWWASIIILVGIGIFTIVWDVTCILWVKPVLSDIMSKKSSKLKEVEDEENTIMKEIIKEENEYEMLKQMAPKPQYGQLIPEEPFRIAIRKFNKDPETGIQYIRENNVLLNTQYDNIITFLHSVDELNKIKLGEYLGGNQPHNKEMLQSFVNYYNFESKEFDEALRNFLSKFKLPREAQQIDRVMESFAMKYHNDNPGKFTDSDTAYLLAFSLILLNTDAHNPAIKNKMSKRVFVQNNINLRKGKKQDLTPEYLEKLYDRIINNELKLDEDTLFSNAQLKGWLYKMSSQKKNWQKRWFVLKNNCLYYFPTEKNEENPKVIIPLEGLKVTKISDTSFQIEDSTVQMIKSVKLTPKGPIEGQHEKYILKASTQEEAIKWIDSISNNVLGSPVLLLIKKKKKLLNRSRGSESRKDQTNSNNNNNNSNNNSNNNNNNINNINHNNNTNNNNNNNNNIINNLGSTPTNDNHLVTREHNLNTHTDYESYTNASPKSSVFGMDDATSSEDEYGKSKQTEIEFLINNSLVNY
ncbi:pleckstrin domain-containing protein [Heterostelium album PN500]|uniref:Pleckstrin domain-containing protein n=1 Tax=Heterostelium pallidum (strain ATCC 26659 / Pp 5 / PN500) TaxID=670386 RepID=D3BQV5_HETP5|nr:pleckstrin domain-containing protein [Heterostelium album PN500]EFA76525.1 pleckstrin domain-containing protein [Heterostelium album PN500]|eukprot:XP_020428657.1 pleckstrin domain-containing protein [Heterostelium album PN500]